MTFSVSANKASHQKPSSIREACAIIIEARNHSHAIIPTGASTKSAIGYPCIRPAVHLDTRALNQVIDYPARDMTITVQAGILMANLASILAKEGQRLPIDDPFQGASTLGGMIATNTSGPRRFGWGTLRDYVIGISILNDEGIETKAGGRVVKNVAGYDFCKLHTGALGTLGLVSQVTLKLRPIVEANAIVAIPLDSGQLDTALEIVHLTATRPVCVDLFNPVAASSPGFSQHGQWLLLVAFEHSKTTTDWQIATLLEEFHSKHITSANCLDSQAASSAWKGMETFQARTPFEPTVTFKANIPPAKVASWSLQATQLFPELLLQAHAGNGIVHGHLLGGDLEKISSGLGLLLEKAVRYQGNLVLSRCPDAWKRDLPVWGAPREDLNLMRKVKQALDPLGIFNPGRFVGHI